MFRAVEKHKPNNQMTKERLSVVYVWNSLRISVGYDGPTVKIRERGILLAFLSTKENHRPSSVTCSDKGWGCTTIGVVASLTP